MLRVCGILLLSAIPIGVGWYKSRQIMREQEEIQGALFLVTQFRQGICYSQLPIVDIIMRLPKKRYELVDKLISCFDVDKSPKEVWDNVSHSLRCIQIKGVMRDLFDSLGASDRASQIKICDMTAEQLREIQLALSEKIHVRSKLSRTIGLLAGAFLAIILL